MNLNLWGLLKGQVPRKGVWWLVGGSGPEEGCLEGVLRGPGLGRAPRGSSPEERGLGGVPWGSGPEDGFMGIRE